MKYSYDDELGIVDDNNVQVLQIIKSNCTKKFRENAGKLLAKALSETRE